MSDIQRRIVTIFDVRGSERVKASLQSMDAGFGSFRRNLDMSGRSSSYLNGQLRALGTTMRYALAGGAVFGTLQLVRNLGQFQAQLGEIQAIASSPGGLPLLDSQIDSLGQKLIDVSNKTTQPISELQSGVLSLYSTIGDIPPNEAAKMMETISNVAITSQSNIEDTTQALLGMLNAFGQGTDQLGKFGDEFFRVIKLSAGMPGSIYAQKLGVLSASASLARFSPEEMGALAIGATRFGGSANTNMTYLAQLMTYLVNPTTAKEKAAFSSIGLSSKDLQTMPGMDILRTVLGAVNKRGGVGISPALAGASEDTLNILDQMNGGAGPTNAQAGISGGGADLLNRLFGRIQSRRMAAILSKLMTQGQVAGTKNQTLDTYLKDVSDKTDNVHKAMGRAMDYRRINQAANAMHNFGIEVGTALSPLLQWPARGITGGISAFNNQTWGTPNLPGLGKIPGQTLEVGGGAIGIALLLKSLKNPGAVAGRVARGAPFVAAGFDALSGDTQKGHSPLNPLYVAVVYSLAGGLTGRNAYGIPNRDMRTAEGELGGGYYASGSRGAKAAARLSRTRRFAYGAGGVVGALVGADILYNTYTQHEADIHARKQVQSHSMIDFLTHKTPRLNIPWTHIGVGGSTEKKTPQERAILDQLAGKKITADQAEIMLRKVASHTQLQLAGATRVKGKVDINITQTDAQGKKKVSHVTTDLFPDFTTLAPQTKGKPTTKRGGQ